MFQFAGYRLTRLWVQRVIIRGSRDHRLFDSSPGLIAVFHALHRLSTPRHPPYALRSLATCIKRSHLPAGRRYPSSLRSPPAEHVIWITRSAVASYARHQMPPKITTELSKNKTRSDNLMSSLRGKPTGVALCFQTTSPVRLPPGAFLTPDILNLSPRPTSCQPLPAVPFHPHFRLLAAITQLAFVIIGAAAFQDQPPASDFLIVPTGPHLLLVFLITQTSLGASRGPEARPFRFPANYDGIGQRQRIQESLSADRHPQLRDNRLTRRDGDPSPGG